MKTCRICNQIKPAACQPSGLQRDRAIPLRRAWVFQGGGQPVALRQVRAARQ